MIPLFVAREPLLLLGEETLSVTMLPTFTRIQRTSSAPNRRRSRRRRRSRNRSRKRSRKERWSGRGEGRGRVVGGEKGLATDSN